MTKTIKPKSETASKAVKKAKGKSTNFGIRPFPISSIEEAMAIPLILKDKNGGNPWDPKSISSALKMGNSDKFYYLTASSRDYGFTSGTRSTKTIELTDLGKTISYPQSDKQKLEAITAAFNNVEIFRKVYDYYNGGNLPEVEYLKNTLMTQFDLPEKYHDEFQKAFQLNVKFLKIPGISSPTQGGRPYRRHEARKGFCYSYW